MDVRHRIDLGELARVITIPPFSGFGGGFPVRPRTPGREPALGCAWRDAARTIVHDDPPARPTLDAGSEAH